MQTSNAQSLSEIKGRGPYICPKCNNHFDKFDEFNVHIKGLCNSDYKKKPYCIIFKGHNEACSIKQKLNLTVDEYFYGQLNGSSKFKQKTTNKKFTCYSCGKSLRNNLRFMSHVRHKIENEWKENDNVNDFNICNHCYRHYSSPFHLQCHIETVHTTVPAATTCRICELNFDNEELFLSHMKDQHSYNELPYVCKLCNYRSSFYLDLTQHFRSNHENCSSLLCPFCLAIHHTTNSFLSHVIQHMNKSVRCSRCRLQFFNAKDKALHLEVDHKSVLKVSNKKKFPKHPSNFTIYVKVFHHPLSPSKNQQAARPLVKALPGADSSAIIKLDMNEGWTRDSHNDDIIPIEFRPYCRESSICITLSLDLVNKKLINCIECGEVLGVFVRNYNKHFQKEYSCGKCVFRSYCYNATRSHIIKMHLQNAQEVDTPLSQVSKTTLKSENTDSIWPALDTPNINTSPYLDSRLPLADQMNASANSFPAEARRESHLPNLITGSLRNSKAESLSRDPSFVLPEDPICVNFDNKLSNSSISADLKNIVKKASLGKRKITDIVAYLEKAENENKQKVLDSSNKSSKQRRKQLKPQKLSSNADSSLNNSGSPASVLLKSLDQMASEERYNAKSLSNGPPVLDTGLDNDNCDWLDTSNQSKPTRKRKQAFNPNASNDSSQSKKSPSSKKLIVKFANHLGLAKKRKTVPPLPASSSPPPKSRVFVAKPLSTLMSDPVKTSTSNAVSRNVTSAQQPKGPGVPASRKMAAQPQSPIVKKPAKKTSVVMPPVNMKFSEVTKSSFLVSWNPPSGCSVTQYKLIFQGSGLPTTQLLPAAQSSVRLIGLRSSTFYLVRLCAMFKTFQSSFIDGLQSTLGLREKKSAAPVKVDDVIVLDDDDDDDVIPISSSKSRPKKSETCKATTPLSGTTIEKSDNKLHDKPSANVNTNNTNAGPSTVTTTPQHIMKSKPSNTNKVIAVSSTQSRSKAKGKDEVLPSTQSKIIDRDANRANTSSSLLSKPAQNVDEAKSNIEANSTVPLPPAKIVQNFIKTKPLIKSGSSTVIISDPGPNKKFFLLDKAKLADFKKSNIKSIKLIKSSDVKFKLSASSTSKSPNEEVSDAKLYNAANTDNAGSVPPTEENKTFEGVAKSKDSATTSQNISAEKNKPVQSETKADDSTSECNDSTKKPDIEESTGAVESAVKLTTTATPLKNMETVNAEEKKTVSGCCAASSNLESKDVSEGVQSIVAIETSSEKTDHVDKTSPSVQEETVENGGTACTPRESFTSEATNDDEKSETNAKKSFESSATPEDGSESADQEAVSTTTKTQCVNLSPKEIVNASENNDNTANMDENISKSTSEELPDVINNVKDITADADEKAAHSLTATQPVENDISSIESDITKEIDTVLNCIASGTNASSSIKPTAHKSALSDKLDKEAVASKSTDNKDDTPMTMEYLDGLLDFLSD